MMSGARNGARGIVDVEFLLPNIRSASHISGIVPK